MLVLDEPTNGLDPDGIRWTRHLLRSLAADGKAVLVSSHLMNEMEETADDFVVIARGRVVAQGDAAKVKGTHRTLEEAFFALTDAHVDYRIFGVVPLEFGLQGTGAEALMIREVTADTRLAAGSAYNVDADAVIDDAKSGGWGGAHNDIAHAEIGRLVWRAALSEA